MKYLNIFIFTIIALMSVHSNPALAQDAKAETIITAPLIYVDVNGLVCDFCARALEKTFGKQEAVHHIDVNLDTKVVTIHLKENAQISREKVIQLITDSGYNVVKVRTEAEDQKEAEHAKE